jgi:hypothetical protein
MVGFGCSTQLSKPVRWLNDNDAQGTSSQTVEIGRELGIEVCTPALYCPESSGREKGFMKRFEHVYVYFSKLPDRISVSKMVLERLWTLTKTHLIRALT